MAGNETAPKGIFHRDDDVFSVEYANNVQLESSAWDLKLTFGQLNQSEGNVTVDQHTEITLPWPQAKVLSYFLRAHLLAYEFENGEIVVPKSAIPIEPTPPSGDLVDNPTAIRLYEFLTELRKKEFFRED
jgi:hypothetical protein